MSTIEDFENAPVGATATNQDGSVRVWKEDETNCLPWVYITYDEWFSNEELVEGGFTLNPAAPTTAREALDLAWELAYPVKEGQIVPKGTEFIQRGSGGTYKHFKTVARDRTVSVWDEQSFRSLEPLSDPESETDWLDAPAVLAWSRWDDVRREKVWSKADECYKSTDGEIANWSDLCYVTPLYPKEEK